MPDWKTNEQEEWLKARLPDFVAAQQRRKRVSSSVSDFLTGVYAEWFSRWPEPEETSPSIDSLGYSKGRRRADDRTPIERKQAQISRWFYWNAQGRVARQTKAGKAWVKRLETKYATKTRPLNRLELYHSLYKDKINKEVEAQIEINAAESKSDTMRIRRQTLREMWAVEDLEVKERVEDAYNEVRNVKVADESDIPVRTAEDYWRSLSALPSVLRATLDPIAESTGWIFFVSAAGPNPSANGAIYMQNYQFGSTDSNGNTFSATYKDYDRGFQRPFSEYVAGCFPRDIRKARAIQAREGSATADLTGSDDDRTRMTRSSNKSVPGEGVMRNSSSDSELEVISSRPSSVRKRRIFRRLQVEDSSDSDSTAEIRAPVQPLTSEASIKASTAIARVKAKATMPTSMDVDPSTGVGASASEVPAAADLFQHLSSKNTQNTMVVDYVVNSATVGSPVPTSPKRRIIGKGFAKRPTRSQKGIAPERLAEDGSTTNESEAWGRDGDVLRALASPKQGHKRKRDAGTSTSGQIHENNADLVEQGKDRRPTRIRRPALNANGEAFEITRKRRR